MNFNIYLNKDTGKKVKRAAEKLHRSRNSIINEALEEWLSKHSPISWPKNFFDFEPVDCPDFKNFRKDFTEIREDPFE
jgi:hypothetical protein